MTILLKPKEFYCRLFPAPAKPIDKDGEEKLIKLGEAMRYNIEREGTLTPRVGYTYFSQFVGHDLTYDPTPIRGPYLDAEQTPNYRTPFLDLDHVYGGGPEQSPQIYDGDPGEELFKLGTTTPTGYRNDLPIKDGATLVGDGEDNRDLDNLVLRQLHVLFLKFHNEAVKQLTANRDGISGIENLGPGTVFERAQRLVRWHYQWIVRHDLLPRILHSSVWNQHNRTGWPLWQSKGGFAIPIEFSLAAFRFGHSMVRNAYGLNCRQQRVVLSDLMAFGHRPSPIQDDYTIEWGRFFDGLPGSGPVASSSFFDTSIVELLHALPPSIIHLSSKMEHSEPPSLPVRTLLRGARAKLPSGQEVADELVRQGVIKPENRLTTGQLTQHTCNRSGSVLRNVGLEENTPLFYYLLKEAELISAGLRLGPIGSHIVVTVIESALEADRNGYMSVIGHDWKLPLWRFPTGSVEQVNSMIRIVRLVGDNQLLPECEARWRRFLPLSAVAHTNSESGLRC
jgi:Animal haem peroxidase